MSDTGRTLAKRIGYRFADAELAGHALTHRSAGSRNNERLEYLGDAVLNLVIAEALYSRLPDLTEGDLSRIRAALVNKETLADIGAELRLGELLQLGPGELKSGGFRRKSILADAVEAVLGAVYLDGGFVAARELVLRLYGPRLSDLPAPESLKDPKTRLQERLQSRGLPLPVYEVTSVTGKAHEQQFVVDCISQSPALRAQGSGRSRREAEQQAAGRLLEELEGRS